MKKLLLILPLVFLLCLTFGCQKGEEMAEEPAVDVAADVEAIKGIIDEITRTWNEGDYEGNMVLIDEEAMFLLANGPTLKGIEEIRSLYSNSFNMNTFDLTTTTDEIHVCGDLAFSRDNWKGSINPKDGSKPTLFDNKVITIFKRQSDGSWKIWRVIYNSNTPPTTE